MHVVRFASSIMAAAVSALACAALAFAQPLTPIEGELHVKGQGDGDAPQLSQVWHETEGDWQGAWTPLHPAARDGVYAARFTHDRTIEHATLQVHFQPGAVRITRTQPNGTCEYQGYLNAAGTVVSGTYHCDWARTPMAWRASIGAVIAPNREADLPLLTSAVPYLHYDWVETEGAWHGHWTPRNPDADDGVYDARWVNGNEHATAELQISMETSRGILTVVRTDPGGRHCVYHATVSPNTLTNVNGTYLCDGITHRMPWHASLQIPRRN